MIMTTNASATGSHREGLHVFTYLACATCAGPDVPDFNTNKISTKLFLQLLQKLKLLLLVRILSSVL